MANLGPRFWAQKSPEKVYVGPFLCPFPGNVMTHINFFLGAQNGAFGVGGKQFMLRKFMCFFCPLFVGSLPVRRRTLQNPFKTPSRTLRKPECTKIAHRRSLAIFAADSGIAGNSAVGIKFVPFNRRENRRSLAVFFAEEIAHVGA